LSEERIKVPVNYWVCRLHHWQLLP